MKFSVDKTDSKCRARTGSINNDHGKIETPVFMPVGTVGAVKTFSPEELEFFNSEIKAARAIGDVSKTFASLYNFYYDKTTALLSKIKTPKTRAQKSKLVHNSQNYLRDNEDKFKAMIDLYKKIQESKQFIIDKLGY